MEAKRTSGHEVDRLQDLQGPYLSADDRPVEMGGRLGAVGAHAADEVRLGVHERPEQVVEPRVEVLRERRDGVVAVEPTSNEGGVMERGRQPSVK